MDHKAKLIIVSFIFIKKKKEKPFEWEIHNEVDVL